MSLRKVVYGTCWRCGTGVGATAYRCEPCADLDCKEYLAERRAALDRMKARKLNAAPRPEVRTPAENSWRAAISRATHTAVRVGLLPDPKGCTCVDCGRQATCYDHRDYSKPLDVEPVCLPCNSSRGRGQMPAPKPAVDFYREREKAA